MGLSEDHNLIHIKTQPALHTTDIVQFEESFDSATVWVTNVLEQESELIDRSHLAENVAALKVLAGYNTQMKMVR